MLLSARDALTKIIQRIQQRFSCLVSINVKGAVAKKYVYNGTSKQPHLVKESCMQKL